MRLDDEQTERQLLAGRLNMLFRDRRAHAYTRHLMETEIMRDPEREVGYGITDSWDEIVETLQGAPVRTDTELGGYVREFEMRVRQDTDEIYMRHRLPHYRDNKDSLEVLHSQSYHRRLVAVHRSDHGLAGSPTQSGLPEEAGGSA
nr:hypothetical protein [Tanacetum cinerariifolium]